MIISRCLGGIKDINRAGFTYMFFETITLFSFNTLIIFKSSNKFSMGKWDLSGIPHKGWLITDVIDIREDGKSEEETQYESCMMCGKEKIRYVHIVTHADVHEEFRVGCICAEKMTDDYLNPKRKEKELKNRANRRNNWLKRKWKISHKGGHSIKIDGHNVGIFKDRDSGLYKCRIDDKFGSVLYQTKEEAKMGLFRKIEDEKAKKRW